MTATEVNAHLEPLSYVFFSCQVFFIAEIDSVRAKDLRHRSKVATIRITKKATESYQAKNALETPARRYQVEKVD